MKTVLGLLTFCATVFCVYAACNSVRNYTETFVPACDANDVYIKWPYYENSTSYYVCNGIKNPVLSSCPTDEHFSYVLQICTPCEGYLPPVQCKYLKTQNPPTCVAISTTTTAAPTTTTVASTNATESTTVEMSTIAPSTEASTGATQTTQEATTTSETVTTEAATTTKAATTTEAATSSEAATTTDAATTTVEPTTTTNAATSTKSGEASTATA